MSSIGGTAPIVKSVQRGQLASSAGTGGTVTVTSVNTAKSQLRLLGWFCSSGAAAPFAQVYPYLKLTNATTVDFVVPAGLGGVTVTVSYELVEYN